MSAQDASIEMLVIGRSGRGSRLVADELFALPLLGHISPRERDSAAGS
jgi:hypothetical protein